jgi:iron(III) transport system permease protein
MQSRAATGSRTRALRGRLAVGANLLFLGVAAFAALPSIAVVLTSVTVPGLWYGSVLPQEFTLGNFTTALTHPLSAGAIRNSLILAGLAVLLDVVVGFVAARLIVRSRIAGRWLLDALVMLPLAVPGLVMAFGYVAMTLSCRSPRRPCPAGCCRSRTCCPRALSPGSATPRSAASPTCSGPTRTRCRFS